MYTIATLGSHSALQILKGAKDEGFKTLLFTTPDRVSFYESFSFIDEIVPLDTFAQLTTLKEKKYNHNIVYVPHGSFVAYLGFEGNKKIPFSYFGSKAVLDWEADREKQRVWLQKAGITMPRHFSSLDEVTYPIIVKTYGAAGGKGYFYAKSKRDFESKIKNLKTKQFIMQEYVIGVTAYIQYFYSRLTKKLEILGVDRRYETNADGLGRIPLIGQEGLDIEPSYVVVGNAPLVLRESLLPEAYAMGERIIQTSQELINEKGLYGPFCLETVITPNQQFYAMEISCRIVAGTNLFMNGSPYSWLYYNEPMSMGKRIAREIKHAIKKNKLDLILN